MSDEVLDTIRKRRTIRRFTDQEVSDEQVDQLLEMAMTAPNRLDRQPWHFFVIRDDALKMRLADRLGLHPYLEMAPVVIAAGARPELSTTWRMDVMAAVENMMIAATSIGLGTAVVGDPDGFLWQTAEELLREALHVPPQREVRIPVLVAVGYPDEERPAHGKHDRFDRTKVHYGLWEKRELGGES